MKQFIRGRLRRKYTVLAVQTAIRWSYRATRQTRSSKSTTGRRGVSKCIKWLRKNPATRRMLRNLVSDMVREFATIVILNYKGGSREIYRYRLRQVKEEMVYWDKTGRRRVATNRKTK